MENKKGHVNGSHTTPSLALVLIDPLPHGVSGGLARPWLHPHQAGRLGRQATNSLTEADGAAVRSSSESS